MASATLRLAATCISATLFLMLRASLAFQFGAKVVERPFLGKMYRFASSVALPAQPNPTPSFSISATTDYEVKEDILVIPFYKHAKELKEEAAIAAELKAAIPSLPPDLRETIASLLDEGIFKGDSGSKQVVRLVNSSLTMPKYVAFVGLGADQARDKVKPDLEVQVATRLGRSLGSIIKETRAKSVAIAVPSVLNNAGLTQLLLGLYDSLHLDMRYKKEADDPSKSTFSSLRLLGCKEVVARDAELTHQLTRTVASGVGLARDLVAAPPNSKTPQAIVDIAQAIANEHRLEINVLGEKECAERGMGGYLAVQQGSRHPPAFLHMVYRPTTPTAVVTKVALIGKGLTFDSGGYNLKAGAGSMIELMKFDMGGCAAVLGCAKTIAQLRPRYVEVHFISALCENMISAEAMHPGDIVRASNGKTIEILNTDAEGRLTLADALVYAESLGVDYIVDLATLTGACIAGLGEKVAGLYASNNELGKALEHAAQQADELLWPMPLVSSYKDSIRGNLADLKNIGGPKGGSITAALFLREFVNNTPWAHIGE